MFSAESSSRLSWRFSMCSRIFSRAIGLGLAVAAEAHNAITHRSRRIWRRGFMGVSFQKVVVACWSRTLLSYSQYEIGRGKNKKVCAWATAVFFGVNVA